MAFENCATLKAKEEQSLIMFELSFDLRAKVEQSGESTIRTRFNDVLNLTYTQRTAKFAVLFLSCFRMPLDAKIWT